MVRVRAGLIIAVLQFVAGAGGNADRVRSAAGFRTGDLLDPERMVDMERLAATVSHAAAELDDPTFGLQLGANFDLEALGLLSYAVLNATTVEIGLKNLTRYLASVAQGVHLELEKRKGLARLRFDLGDADSPQWRHLHEAAILALCRIIRRLVGDECWRPSCIGLAHDRTDLTHSHETRFGIVPTFGSRTNEICFDSSALKQEVFGTDRSLLPIVEQRLQRVLQLERRDESWLAELYIQIAKRLCDGHPSLPRMAPSVGLSARTLQRRLAARDLVFRTVVEQVRRRVASQYLEQSDTCLTEIAFLLGYSELSAFAHAFKRWTGSSPGAYRRSHRQRALR